jgi:CheY-like chemotaxis protein
VPQGKILVVDDDPDAAAFCRELLEGEGYAVRTASAGPEALGVAEEWAPDVVLLDIRLPVMDGYEVARRLSERTPPVPIVLFTSLTPETIDDERIRAATGVQTILYKPCRPRALLDAIEQVRLRGTAR